MIMERVLYSVAEVSEMLNLSKNRIYELIYAGELASIKIGRIRRISKASIQRFVETETTAA
ncbi:excisionase family DNA binding protein [Friedmanniella endophytica]|uniref:Excisionase family DNA binding protein n=1 Tax=Microlunatus kandeliicorticis TaxID=1759536 RepID=A0A7W3IRR5_9ACTN|nr:helix-turn-helix domain-containing protein [Microlunatus kandeliicorticis]MBA8794027.1 excisionase family DNA binding protein [Microlunatus kandeliicorticis]